MHPPPPGWSPTAVQEVARYAGKWNGLLRACSSPVFLSTQQDGTIVEGLAGLPQGMEGPVLFCGNHQVCSAIAAVELAPGRPPSH